MSNTLTWKGLELSVYLQGVAGNKIFNANKIDLTGMSAAYNQLNDVLSRWHGEGTSTSMPRAVYGDPNQNNRVSDRYVENGAYLRLKSISLTMCRSSGSAPLRSVRHASPSLART